MYGNLFAALTFAFLCFLAGLALGTDYGKKLVHSGISKCQTLPDGNIHCWNIKDEKESNQQN